MAINVAINGFGRIGRLVFRLILEDKDFNIVAINDLTNPDELAYLLKYDTSHRRYKVDEITSDKENIIVDGKKIRVYKESDPTKLPWKDLNIDLVFECTGFFTSKEKAETHIKAGAKKVIISAPAKGDLKTIVYNVNHRILTGDEKIISAASCTTNCLAPVMKLLCDNYGVEKGFMTTVHAYTNDQSTLDVAHKKGFMSRRGRAAAANIVPTTTGAASAIGLVIPELKGRLDGTAMRVGVTTGSVIDLTLELKKKVTKEEINYLFKSNQSETIKYTEDPIVSSDVIGIKSGSLVDGLLTNIVEVDNKQLVKIVAWYDNEMSYSSQMVRCAKYFANK